MVDSSETFEVYDIKVGIATATATATTTTTTTTTILSRKLTGHIGFGLSVRTSVRSSRTVHARVLKFHIWIPHRKIADTRYFSCTSYLPF